jgi:excisionase family DNA binding protein
METREYFMPVKIDGKEYLRTAEAAEYADVTSDTIALWCRQGRVECMKTNTGRWLIGRSALELLLQGKDQSHQKGRNAYST